MTDQKKREERQKGDMYNEDRSSANRVQSLLGSPMLYDSGDIQAQTELRVLGSIACSSSTIRATPSPSE